jgi:hypothetical protein
MREEVIMLPKEMLHKEIESLPDKYANEILDFVCFLKEKLKREQPKTALISESSLKKDWLSSEEDKAWENL